MLLHPSNAPSPKVLTLPGKWTLPREVRLNAYAPLASRPSGRFTARRLMQPSKKGFLADAFNRRGQINLPQAIWVARTGSNALHAAEEDAVLSRYCALWKNLRSVKPILLYFLKQM